MYHCGMTMELSPELPVGPLDIAHFELSPQELLAALADHEREAARLALAVRWVELQGEWANDGSTSFAAWLRTNARMSAGEAFSWIKAGRFLDRFPRIAEGVLVRRLSFSQMQVMRERCPESLMGVMSGMQSDVVDALADLGVADTVTAMDLWKARAEALIDGDEPTVADRELVTARNSDGTLSGRFTLSPAAGVEFQQALRNATTWDGAADDRTRRQRAGDALGEIAAFYNKHHLDAGTPRHRPHVALSLDASTLDRPEAVDSLGQLVPHTVSDTLLCDCVIHRVVRADGVVTDVGRAVYTVPAKMFTALAARDGGCRYPGCHRPVAFTDAHHIQYWRNGGHTAVGNLVLLCSRHHHHVHQQRESLLLQPDGELHVTHRDGTTHTSQPRGAPPTRSP
jgi:hypothetical protein